MAKWGANDSDALHFLQEDFPGDNFPKSPCLNAPNAELNDLCLASTKAGLPWSCE